jgi:hypothetical protein
MQQRRQRSYRIGALITMFLVCPLFAATGSGQSMETEQPLPSIDPQGIEALSSKSISTRIDPDAVGPYEVLEAQTKTIHTGPGFEGFGFDDNAAENGGVLFIPPDAIGAAGKSRVIAVVNTMIEARNKGGQLKWRDSLAGFFAPLNPLTFTFDPKIVYDQYEDRFVVVTLEVVQTGLAIDPGNISRVLVAVSKDGNPKTPTAADWYYHAIDSKVLFLGFVELWADYPGFEVDEEAVYITANMFAFPPFGGLGGVRLWIVDKGSGSGGFYDGGAAAVSIYDPYASGGIATTTQPAQVYGEGGVGGPGSSIGTFLVSYSGLTFGGPGAPEAVQIVTVDDPLGEEGGPFFTQEFVIVGDIEDVGGSFGFPSLPDAPQLDSIALIEVNDRRALDAVWRNGSLWMTTTINPNLGPDTGETTAHWFQVDTQLGPGLLSVSDQGDIGGEDIAVGTTTFFPSVAVNRRGDAMFGFSASADSIYAGAYVTGREADDPLTTVQDTEVVKAGEDAYLRTFGGTRNRWGDYSGISVDPTNEKFVWVFNQFADLRGTPTSGGQDGRWGTYWMRAKFKGGR